MGLEINNKKIKIGIQGGKGSFNEEACHQFCDSENIPDYVIEYLYTSEAVLVALDAGEIDYGQCAIQNAIGGMVRETVSALSKHICEIAYEFEFEVNHCLHARPGVTIDDVRIIMSHPQALAQCQHNLAHKYSDKELKTETGKLIDQALLAQHLGEGKLGRSVSVLAPRICSELYGLDIIDQNLQDMKNNFTTFIWFKK